MKRTGFNHPKTLRLARVLAIPKCFARGVLESLWHWTAMNAPRGDIGKWEDGDIAEGIGWDDDPARLIEGLITAGWLHRDPVHRLIIHDWQAHAEAAVGKLLERNKLKFAVATNLDNTDSSSDGQTCSIMFEHVCPALAEAEAEALALAKAVAAENAIPANMSDQPKKVAKKTAKKAKRPSVLKSSLSSASASNGKGKSDGKPPPTAEAVSQLVRMHLGYVAKGKDAAQYAADLTCFDRIGQFVANGNLGPPGKVADACYAKAKNFHQKASKPVARLMAWFKQELEKHGHDWSENE